MEYIKFLPIVFAIISGFMILFRVPVILDSKGKKSLENFNLSIIIPAYNEEKRIIALLQSLLMQNYKPFEIIVVNDKSIDSTASVCRSFGVMVIDSLEVSGNWVGKSRACWSGAMAAKGDIILFLDADTYLVERNSLEKILTAYIELGGSGILSIQPYHQIRKFYENFSAIFNVVLMAGLNVFTPWKRNFKAAGAFGPCLICQKDEYFLTGGHETIKTAVLDDIEIGKSYIRNKLPLFLYSGKGIIDFRMYPDGIAQLFEGWSKNFGSGAKSTHPLIFIMIFLWITGGFSITAILIKSCYYFDIILMLLSLILYIIYMFQIIWLTKKAGNFSKISFILFALHHLFFTGTFLWSFIQTNILRRVFWRGRKIKT